MRCILYFYTLLFLFLATGACKEKEEVVPFEKTKVKNIKIPAGLPDNNGLSQGYSVLHLGYNGDRIEYITNRTESVGKSELRDSTHFYYVAGDLDYAIQYERVSTMSGDILNLKNKITLLKNEDGDITKVIIDQIGITPDVVIDYSYKDGRLETVKNEYVVDSISYNFQGKIDYVKTFNSWRFEANLIKDYRITAYTTAYNPYYLINKRLGFPVLSVQRHRYSPYYNSVEDLTQLCIKSMMVVVHDSNLSTVGNKNQQQWSVELLYDTDKYGRVVAQYTEASRNQKTTFEYY